MWIRPKRLRWLRIDDSYLKICGAVVAYKIQQLLWIYHHEDEIPLFRDQKHFLDVNEVSEYIDIYCNIFRKIVPQFCCLEECQVHIGLFMKSQLEILPWRCTLIYVSRYRNIHFNRKGSLCVYKSLKRVEKIVQSAFVSNNSIKSTSCSIISEILQNLKREGCLYLSIWTNIWSYLLDNHYLLSFIFTFIRFAVSRRLTDIFCSRSREQHFAAKLWFRSHTVDILQGNTYILTA